MSFKRTLIELGLNETDARFYLAALELGQATVRDVANQAGISRTNAYDVLARLADEGLVSHRPAMAGQKTMVIADPPERLIELLDQRRKRAVEVLPELRSIHNRSHAKPRVRYYEGLDGIKSVLDATLTASDQRLLGILSMQDLYQVPGREWMDDHVRRRIDAGIELRAVRSSSKDIHGLWAHNPAELRDVRYAPPDFVFTMTSYIYDDCVALISSQRENFAMTLQSEEFAAMQRHMFEALWVASSPPATCSAGRQTKRTRARQDRTRLSAKDPSAPSLNVVSSAKGTQ